MYLSRKKQSLNVNNLAMCFEINPNSSQGGLSLLLQYPFSNNFLQTHLITIFYIVILPLLVQNLKYNFTLKWHLFVYSKGYGEICCQTGIEANSIWNKSKYKHMFIYCITKIVNIHITWRQVQYWQLHNNNY